MFYRYILYAKWVNWPRIILSVRVYTWILYLGNFMVYHLKKLDRDSLLIKDPEPTSSTTLFKKMVTLDKRHLTRYTRHMTHDTWYVTCDTWWGMNIPSKCQLLSSFNWHWFEDIFTKDISVNHKGVCRTPRLHRVC